ncbi:hypothetical protein BH10PSE17_BH10PSE17_15190 [soil metagenome]
MLLLIPDLLAPADFLRSALQGLALPGLSRLLSLARVVGQEPDGGEFQRSTPASRWLFAQAGVTVPIDNDAPWALAFAALDGVRPETGATAIALLSPCHFALARDHVVLTGLAGKGAVPLPDIDSWRRMTAQVAGLVEGMLTLDCTNNQRWYAGGEWLAGLRSADPLRAFGRNVDRWLPVDAGTTADRSVAGPARTWRKLHNEIQMSWFADAGEEANVNAVWLHGPATTGITARPPAWSSMASTGDDRWQAFAAWTSRPWSKATTLSDAVTADLVVLDALTMPLVSGDVGAWRDVMTQLDRDWFVPLAAGAADGTTRIVACSELGWREFECPRRAWQFWGRRGLEQQLVA